ncbi:MAG: hypothetical protein HZA20_06355 [Nitrospirae bacterium]|nr:hypothetical protein [Nitrospirota bacterium]
MKKIAGAVAAVIAVLAFQVVAPGEAQAIPAFARQYNTECKTCHTIFPERNEFGEAFEKNGFIWPGKKSPKQVQQKNEALFLSGIPSEIPISFMGTHEAVYNKDSTPRLNLFGTSEFEMFTAGSFQDKAGWFAEYNFSDGATGEIYIKFRNPLNVPVFVRAGNFKPVLNLWKSNNRAALEKMDYIQMKVGKSPFKINSAREGVEVSKIFGSRIFAAAGALNSNTDDADGNPTRDSNDWYIHAQARLSGTDYEGNEPEVSLDSDSIMDFLTITVGGFWYSGSSQVVANDFSKAGIEAEVMYRTLRFRLGFTKGNDDNPNGDNKSLESSSWLAQASYLIGSDTMVVARYESLDNGAKETTVLAPSVAHNVLQNVKVVAEYVHKKVDSAREDKVVGAIVYAF